MTADAWLPEAATLPAEIAVFPLTGALLLPFGRLPLNIFEPRYLAMIEDSLAHGRMFGMIQPNAADQAGASGPALYRVGCLGRVSSFSETDDGRLLVTLTGVIRFTVAQDLPMRHGYRRVRADYAAFLGDLDATIRPILDRERLEDSLKAYFRANRIDANWDAVRETPDAMLITTLAMVCPFEPREKQALLEAPSIQDRADMLLALVEIGAHGGPDEGGARLS
ncbi:LON peptidase substrate-binding domain-containing protein [Elioraea sp.]|uniref:LON peptidase substrate-binding domain-containing protein n=1 Tax=Elioraea sp. TaxID=2185103 RepID=UPI0025C36CE4|nr:LON peptidase substrate-binding domain-containing protein [Elioraea sp.]